MKHVYYECERCGAHIPESADRFAAAIHAGNLTYNTRQFFWDLCPECMAALLEWMGHGED